MTSFENRIHQRFGRRIVVTEDLNVICDEGSLIFIYVLCGIFELHVSWISCASEQLCKSEKLLLGLNCFVHVCARVGCLMWRRILYSVFCVKGDVEDFLALGR